MLEKNNNILIHNYDLFDSFEKDISQSNPSNIDLVDIRSNVIENENLEKWEVVEFIEKCKLQGIDCYIGGGFSKTNIKNGNLIKHIKYLHSLGIETVELSQIIGEKFSYLSLNKLVRTLSGEFKRVLINIGTNANTFSLLDYKLREESITASIETGVNDILLGKGIGFYDNDYNIKTLLLIYTVKSILEKGYKNNIIFAAEIGYLQEKLISLLGPNMKISNIVLNETDLEHMSFIRDHNKGFNKGLLLNFFDLLNFMFNVCEKYDMDPNYFFFNNSYDNLDENIYLHMSNIEKEARSISGKVNFLVGMKKKISMV